MAGLTTDNGSTLLVPMHLDAYVVNKKEAKEATYNRWRMDYSRIDYLESPMPPPFDDQKNDPQVGVHLHWALPDGLTRGVENKETGQIEFPYLPDRWLVVRLQPGERQAEAGLVPAWVLLSDALGQECSSAFIHPFQRESESVPVTRLGRNETLDEWEKMKREEGVIPGGPFLKAIAPGNVAFAAFAPGVENVFAFYDDLKNPKPKDPQAKEPIKLTYLVLGWYSQPVIMDPLACLKRTDWEDNGSGVRIADGLQWAVRLDHDADPPTRTLVHGMVYGVGWDEDGEPPQPATRPKSVRKQVRVAVGNTGIEALAALISSQAENAGQERVRPELLEAFQYNLLSTLDEPGGEILLQQGIRQASFGSEPGGTLWMVVAREGAETQAGQKPILLTGDQAARLAELNQKQAELDAQCRRLASMQWELYALWWKSKRIGHVPPFESRDRRDAVTNAKTQLPKHLDARNDQGLLYQVKALQERINTELEPDVRKVEGLVRDGLPADLELKPVAMPRFWHPADPVIVVSGLGRSEKHGYDGTLFCRLLSQTIEAISVRHGGKEVRLQADRLANVIPQRDSPYLPLGTDRLLTEAFFLDPGNAPVMAQAKADLGSPAATEDVSRAIVEYKPDVPEGLSTIGRCGALPWEQPWVPLFLDWQVKFTYGFDPEHFNGTGYDWTSEGKTAPSPLTYSGRTFLTPAASMPFLDRLRQYVQLQPPDVQAAQDLLAKVEKWDILSQTMSGFSSQLVLRDVQPNVLPDDTVKGYVETHYETVPFVNIVPDVHEDPEPPFFFPLRAGFFTFQKLRIIDSFGRILDLMKANGNGPSGKATADDFVPIRGRGMASDRDPDRRRVILAPRVVQGSRLSFRYVSAQEDNREAGQEADTSPVCGWLLPHHLDSSVAVYDAGGSLLGEIMLVPAGQGEGSASWQGVSIPNPHLAKMIDAFRRPGGGATFDNLLQAIDNTLWTSDPLGQRGDQSLAVLIGRPLALVRAKLQLQLNGNPFYNQAWHRTFKVSLPLLEDDSSDLLDLAFPIRLGRPELRNNGLIGYFEGDKYLNFHAVQLPGDSPPAPYVELTFEPSSSAYLTMLIDPLGVVQAESGLLPTKTLELPQRYFVEPLKRMAVRFRVGPLLLDSEAVRIPQPAAQGGTWSWIEATGERPKPIVHADDRARLAPTPPELREGWLQFKPQEIDK